MSDIAAARASAEELPSAPMPSSAVGTPGQAPQEVGFAENLRGVVAVAVAILLLVAFGVLIFFLLGEARSADEDTWLRFMYIFGAAEALVFTAVGWLFGREVNRQSTENAEARADQATAKVEAATVAAADQEAKGRALRAAVESRAMAASGGSRVEERGIGGSDTPPTDISEQARELAEFARLLFPDR